MFRYGPRLPFGFLAHRTCCSAPQITAGCATLEPWAALLTGMAGGSLYLLGSRLLVRLRIDDAVDAGKSELEDPY